MIFSINVKCSLKIFPFILLIVLLFIKNYIENKPINDSDNKKNDWFDGISIAILNKSFYFFSIFFFLIYRKLNKIKNENEKKNENNELKLFQKNPLNINNANIEPIVKVPQRKNNTNKVLLLSLFCVFLTVPIDTIKIKNSYSIHFTSVVFGFITILFFNHFLFKKTLEKHKQLSIILICLFNLPFFIYFCITDTKKEFFDVVFFISVSIKFCIYQYIMNNLFISFYFIFFIEGLCFFIFFAIINIILLIMLFFKENKFKEYYNLKLLLKNIVHFSVHFLYFFHINFYDSMNCMIMEIFSRGLCTIVITEKAFFIKIIDAIITILSLISIFIYEEIIILNFCEFGKYVQKNLLKREKEYENNISIEN